MERERLRRRQQEIKSHVSTLFTSISFQESALIQNLCKQIGEDPFLPANLDTHTRQESGDSGLSLPSSSTSQSASHTPDFLSNIDDSMDGLSGELQSVKVFPCFLLIQFLFCSLVTDNTMDTMPFNDNIDNSDEFMVSLFQIIQPL